jgi:hypothetical protein
MNYPKWYQEQLKAAEKASDILVRRELRHLRKSLGSLVDVTTLAIRLLDEEMKKPSDAERGKRIAKICNGLEFEKDRALHFGLHKPFRKAKP